MNRKRTVVMSGQRHSRAKAQAANAILEALEERLSQLPPGGVSLYDDFHGNIKVITDILNEVLP